MTDWTDEQVEADLAALEFRRDNPSNVAGESWERIVVRLADAVPALLARAQKAEAEAERLRDLTDEFRKRDESAGNAIQLAVRERQHETRIRLELLREFWRAVHDQQDAPDGWLISESELICAVQDMHRPDDCEAVRLRAELAEAKAENERLRQVAQSDRETAA